MDLKKIRSLHLYLGCFFAPLIILFILSGVIQTLGFDHDKYGPLDPATGKAELVYKSPDIVKIMKTMHTNHGYKTFSFQTNALYMYFVVAMAFGLLITIILGIVMAFKYTNPALVWWVMAAGIIAPIALILL